MSNAAEKRAVVLLSGGIDSATVLAIAMREMNECIALTFQYGQRHVAEVQAASRLAVRMGVRDHLIISIPLGEHVASALTDRSVAVPGSPDPVSETVPATYVPARNTIFLAYALAIAETAGAGFIYTGVSSVDYSGYPDCRPEFIRAFQSLAALATKSALEGRPVEIQAPLQYLSKAETIGEGIRLGVDYSLTLTCYDPDDKARPCGRCDSCRLRRRGFDEAGIEDPADYRRIP